MLLLSTSMTPFTLVYLHLSSSLPHLALLLHTVYHLPALFTQQLLNMPSSPRRSQRLLQRKTCDATLSDFDYPGPKRNSRTGRIRKSTYRNRRIPEEVIVIDDQNPEPRVSDSPKKIEALHTLAPPQSKSKTGPVRKRPLLAIPYRITTGRVRKPNVHRQLPLKKDSSSIPSIFPDEFVQSGPLVLPTSPLSTQDSYDINPQQSDSIPSSTNFSLGFEPEGPVLGREEESNQLTQHLSSALKRGRPSLGIYVCGTPGTGKTYTVSKVAKRLRTAIANESENERAKSTEDEERIVESESEKFTEVWVNCANLHQPKDLFSHLTQQLNLRSPQQNPREAIREYACSSGPKTLVVLDEVDFLTSKDQMVLYSAFEWPRINNSRIVVVGIANSIDLPVRLLPWLRQAGCMPEIVSFTPYGATSLQGIVQQRIQDLDASGLSAVAISLAAKKVAAGSGDARLMLDVCREAQCEMQREGKDKSCITVVASIISRRGGLSAAVETIRQLPVQQQLALCVAANAVSFSSRATCGGGKLNKKATLGGLYDSFERLCQRAHVSVLSFPEFADICCNALMHHGLVDVPLTGRGKSAKTLRGRPIRLRVPIEDVRAGIADKGFLPMLIVK